MNVHNTPRGLTLITLVLLLAAGIFLRIHPWAGFKEEYDPAHGIKHIGFDEALYIDYVDMISAKGMASYPVICEFYIYKQRGMPSAILPPTRFLYIFCAWLWHAATGWTAFHSLHAVSCMFTIFTLLLSAAFAWRLGGNSVMLGVTALMAVAPTQIHMGQHALIDGVFAFWALCCLWLLWENLRSPDNPLWLSLYAVSIALMVMTKENAAFVYVALCGVTAAGWRLKIGRVTLKLLLVSAVGPLLGLAVLVNLAGGPGQFITIYRLLVEKAYALEYAIRFCDGPWHRYLIDLLLVSPLVLLPAIGAVFAVTREKKPQLFLLAFLTFSYLFMANVKYGMNLRYANMWDMPLRYLAFSQLAVIGARFGRRETIALAVMVAAVCLVELRQYFLIFVQFPMYELISEALLRAVKMLK